MESKNGSARSQVTPIPGASRQSTRQEWENDPRQRYGQEWLDRNKARSDMEWDYIQELGGSVAVPKCHYADVAGTSPASGYRVPLVHLGSNSRKRPAPRAVYQAQC
jgi:hypothetical protein